jgi:cell division septum initiation protein DivIVA
MADPKWEDTEPVLYEDSEIPKWEDTEEVESIEPETRTGEALLSGFGSGATASFSDELGGAIGAGLETAASYIPGTDAYESKKLDEQLREQGFSGDLQDKQNLLDRYKESRDYIRDYQKKLQEQHPIASGIGEVAGGLATAPLVPGGAAKGAGTMAKVAAGAKQGLAGGAMYGAGASEAEVLEGDVAGLLTDTVEAGVGGALVGGALPAAGGLIKGTGKLFPGTKTVSSSYQYGKEGKLLTSENVKEDIKKLSNKIYNGTRTRFKKYGKSKEEGLKFADTVAKKIDAGETLQEQLNEAIEARAAAVGDEARADADKWVKILKELVGEESRPMAKAREAAEKHRAKAVIKNPNAEIGDVETFTQDNRVGAKYDVTKLDPKTRRLVDKPEGVQIGEELTDTRDVRNLSVSDLEKLIKDFRASMFKSERAATPEARQLQAKLYSLREDFFTNPPAGMKKRDLRKLAKLKNDYDRLSRLTVAREDLGIDKILSSRSDSDAARKVDKIRELIGQTSDSAQFKKDRIYSGLKKVDRKFGTEIESRGKQLEDLKDVLGMEDIRTQNIKGLAGAATTLVGKGANIAGRARYVAGKAATAGKDVLLKPYELIKKYGPQQLTDLAESMERTGGVGVEYANQLRKAATGDGKTKTAILHGLYQQPGFRESMRRLNVFDEE